jgi:signal transduction histidine kinase
VIHGNGLGLATVRSVVLKDRGRIWAQAEKGREATFYFSLGQPVLSATSAVATGGEAR